MPLTTAKRRCYVEISTASDTIDHTILLNRLKTSFGISRLALTWFHSYLEGRSQFIRIGCSTSQVTLCTTGVLQGSVFGPMFFLIHILHISSIPMASCSSCTLTTISSISPYPVIIPILKFQNSSYVSQPSIPGSAITG